MTKISKAKRALHVAALFSVGYLSTTLLLNGASYLRSHTFSNKIADLAQKVSKEQEATFGIRYSTLPEFIVAPLSGEIGISNESNVIASYLAQGEKLTVNSTWDGLEEKLKSVSQASQIPGLERTLSHELSHHYLNLRSQELGNGIWPDLEPYTYLLEQIANLEGSDKEKIKEEKGHELSQELALRAVSEGIAQYLEIGDRLPWTTYRDMNQIAWPRDYVEISSPQVYELLEYNGGYHLVKPILDKFGSKGIDHIILNPPKITRLDELPAWRDNVMQALEIQEREK